jgi:DNA-directed RNA polymerase specialized sigma24 family protein
MFSFQSKPVARPTFEDVFFRHHDRLHEWALQLTGGRHSDAEDLVQELFVRIAGLGPVAEHIENPENYLFSSLRNLYYARIRRARTSAIDDLSIVDYESAERSLRAADRNGILFIREDLHRVCDYLCERKESSRSASIFILRYFLGYFPLEIVQVVRTPRSQVDWAIHTVRREARLELERPGVLREKSAARPKTSGIVPVDDTQGLFAALRASIFRSNRGTCPAPGTFAAKYAVPGESLTTAELAHIVSCPRCLDEINTLLGLPLLADRSPDEVIHRDTTPGPKGGGASGGTPILVRDQPKKRVKDPQRLRARMYRCLEEVKQHRPRQLMIAVDGDVRALHRVATERSELRAVLRPMERPTFLEVLSEQEICLGFVFVEALNSDSNLLQVSEIELRDGRRLSIAISFVSEAPAVHVTYWDPLFLEEIVSEEQAEPLPYRVPEFRSMVVVPEASEHRLWSWFKGLFSFGMNPLLTSAVLFGVCSVLCFLLWTRSGPKISATTLLSRSQQSDVAATEAGKQGIVYQRVRIEASHHAVERAIYRDPLHRRKPKQQPLNSDGEQLKAQIDSAGVDWNAPLSAASYAAWHDRLPAKADVVTLAGEHLLKITTSNVAGGEIAQQSLTVRDNDFHPVERTIELRNATTIEIAELDYAVVPWGAVNDNWFEPDMGEPVRAVPGVHPSIQLPRVLSALELDEAELAARTVLNQLHADAGEQISLVRGTEGIEVKGVVDTNSRKRELLTRLALVPHVHALLLSAEEIGPRASSGPVAADGLPVHVSSEQVPSSPLEQYFHDKNLPLDQLVPASDSLLDGSLRIVQAGNHLSELQLRFQEANQLPVDAQDQLETLSRNYIGTITANLYANRQILLSLGFVSRKPVPENPTSQDSNREIDEQLRRYRQLCLEMVSNETVQTRPASVIAGEILDAGERIRLYSASMSVTVRKK